MFFGEATINDALVVSKAIWSFQRLSGPYRDRNCDPNRQTVISNPDFTDVGCEELVGVYTNHDGQKSNFVHTTIIDDDGLWVYAGPTIGSLPESWSIGAYPFEDKSPTTWLKPLYDDLHLIVKHVNDSIAIKGATYGWLTSEDCDTLLAALDGTIPIKRWGPFDMWRDGQNEHYPATNLEAPMDFND